MTYRIIPAIMSGGAGTRLWRFRRKRSPNSFTRLAVPIRCSLRRFAAFKARTARSHSLPPIILCNESHRTAVEADLATIDVGAAAIALEPEPKNTAAVGVIASALGAEIDPRCAGAPLAGRPPYRKPRRVSRSDRTRRVDRARAIVTFGITPDRPATEYGYIKRGAQLSDGVFALDSFREKPNEATARQYLSEGGYAWNAGMFFFSPRVMLEEFNAAPEIRDACLAALKNAQRDGVEVRLDASAFAKSPSQPLDIAVMEKTHRAAVAPCEIGWADVGSWDEIWRLSERDASGKRPPRRGRGTRWHQQSAARRRHQSVCRGRA